MRRVGYQLGLDFSLASTLMLWGMVGVIAASIIIVLLSSRGARAIVMVIASCAWLTIWIMAYPLTWAVIAMADFPASRSRLLYVVFPGWFLAGMALLGAAFFLRWAHDRKARGMKG